MTDRTVRWEVYERHETGQDWEWFAEADTREAIAHYFAMSVAEPGMEARLVRVIREIVEDTSAATPAPAEREPDWPCCDSDSQDYSGHVCLACGFLHCHCEGGTPGPQREATPAPAEGADHPYRPQVVHGGPPYRCEGVYTPCDLPSEAHATRRDFLGGQVVPNEDATQREARSLDHGRGGGHQHRYPANMPDEVLAWRCADCGEVISEFSGRGDDDA